MVATEQRFRLALVTPANQPLQLAYDAFIIAQEAQRHSPLTHKWYRDRLGRFMEFLAQYDVQTPESITSTICRQFIVTLQRQGLAANTVHGYAQVLKTFCRFVEREDFSPTNAMARVQMPKLPKEILPAFSPDDVKTLLDACHSARDRAMVLCLLDSGARGSEFCALRVQDVDLRTGTVRIIHGKGAKDRTCYLGGKARKALVHYLRERPGAKPEDHLWLSENTGEALTYTGLAQMLKRLGQRAGVSACHPHTFRRTCALWSLRAGMSVYHLQALMGHQDLEVLRRYLQLVESDAEEAHKRFGAVDNML